jgi:hypothetical protein
MMRTEYTSPVGSSWTPAASAIFDEMRQAILSDPCLLCYNHRKLLVLRTNFSANGFGYVACQPANNKGSLATMRHCMHGKGFEFMTKTSTAVLHPVVFGCRRTRSNKTWLHSHLGKGFAGDWAINKNRHMCFGQHFTWVTDCYAIKFVLSYDGQNPSISCLQMRLMCWDMDIEHRNNIFLTDVDYWSCLGVHLCFDPLLKSYIKQVNSFCQCRASPTALPPAPKNMPYFRGPQLPPNVASPNASAQVMRDEMQVGASLTDMRHSTQVNNAPTIGFQHVLNYAVCFGRYVVPCPANANSNKLLYNYEITITASILSKFDWAMYGFNNGHFHLMIIELRMPFDIVLACDPYANGCALFTEICLCPTILLSAPTLPDHVHASGNTAPLTGYLIHSHRYTSTKPTHRFWDIQVHIVLQLHAIRSL